MLKRRAFGIVLCFLALSVVFSSKALVEGVESRSHEPYGDALTAQDIEKSYYHTERVAATSLSPGFYETSEYLIGSVAVGVVFLQCDGSYDWASEHWTTEEESNVMREIHEGLADWETCAHHQIPSVNMNFQIADIQYRVPVSCEPIRHPHTWQEYWIDDAMGYLGYNGNGDYVNMTRTYVNSLRAASRTNWCFAIYVVDSSNETTHGHNGAFPDIDPDTGGNWYAWGLYGGPYLVMTYNNSGWGIDEMHRVCAHETAHIFYATDEYNGRTEYSGYLNASDVEHSGCLMDNYMDFPPSSGTKRQVGWLDQNHNGIYDVIDTFPETTLVPYSPDPTYSTTLTYAGTVFDVPYPNRNPYGSHRSVTINTIVDVEYRIDEGNWLRAIATDGTFDEDYEDFTFTTPFLSIGTHTIEVRGNNSVGNVETSYGCDIVTRIERVLHVPGEFSSIKSAVDAAQPGDHVQVASGTYDEGDIRIYWPLTLTGEGKTNTIIEGGISMCTWGGIVNMSDFTIGCISLYGSAYTVLRRVEMEYFEPFPHPGEYGWPTVDRLLARNIDASNTARGRPIYYWTSQADRQLPNDAGCVAIVNSTAITIKNLCLTNNGVGILLAGTNGSTVENVVTANNAFGITLIDSNNNTVINSTVVGNRLGISLRDSRNNSICGNAIIGKFMQQEFPQQIGIFLRESDNNTISRNRISGNEVGIYLECWYGGSYNNIFVENTISDNGCGIEEMESNDIVCYHNNFVHNSVQMSVEWGWEVLDNGYPSGGNYWSDYAGNDTFSGPYQNETGSDGIGDTPYVASINAFGNVTDHYPLIVPYHSPVLLGPIYIKSDGSVDPSVPSIQRIGDTYTLTCDISCTADGIVIERDNVVIVGMGYRLQGIKLPYSTGIYLQGLNNVTIEDMNIKEFWQGIFVLDSSNSTIIGISTTNNGNGVEGGYGVDIIGSSNVSIIGSNVTRNYCGIYLCESSNTTISENSIRDNWYGIWLSGSSNIECFHNNFINNTVQTFFDYPSDAGVWDNGYPSGGNYWSDYNGSDLYSGPYQNETGSDGIGDTPYIIDENNQDLYPLMGPFGGLTIEGENITAFASGDVCIIFENVSIGGLTTVNKTETGPEPLYGFKLAEQYYNIRTTANHTGRMKIRIIYDDSNMTQEEEEALRLMQWNETSQEWVDITTFVDNLYNVIFGETSHLSTFALLTPTHLHIRQLIISGPHYTQFGVEYWIVELIEGKAARVVSNYY